MVTGRMGQDMGLGNNRRDRSLQPKIGRLTLPASQFASVVSEYVCGCQTPVR